VTTDQTHQAPVPTAFPEPGQDAPPPKPHGKRPWLIGGAIAGAIAAVTIAVANTGDRLPLVGPSEFTSHGILTLHQDGFDEPKQCTGYYGYGDIHSGTDVTMWNADGKVLGVGQLGDGFVVAGACAFPWTVDGIPGGEGPYQYEISHRGRLTITEPVARGTSLSTLGR
jgi:hypothetical protein